MEKLQTQGLGLPKLGLGTYKLTGAEGQAAVESALGLGYRHLDTAEMYGNEEEVGAALAASGVARRDVHVTTKVWYDHLSPDALRRAFAESLRKLRLDYVDFYLVHWPAPGMDMAAIFETLAELQAAGGARAVGVCNFTLPLLRQAEAVGAPIACNQVEYHVLLDQAPLLAYLRERGIPLVAYCPLAQGALADHPELAAIGRKHDASPAQVALKWLLDQEGVAAIPKAQRPASQQANLDALKVELDEEDRAVIAALPKDRRRVDPTFAPAWDEA